MIIDFSSNVFLVMMSVGNVCVVPVPSLARVRSSWSPFNLYNLIKSFETEQASFWKWLGVSQEAGRISPHQTFPQGSINLSMIADSYASQTYVELWVKMSR